MNYGKEENKIRSYITDDGTLKYVQIPNYISESCNDNKYILPVYAYSKIYCNNRYAVITTIEAITKTFYGNHYDKRCKKHEEITQALIALCKDNDNFSSVIQIDEDYTGKIDWKSPKTAIKYQNPILYEFDNIREYNYHYTKLTYAEFDYISSSIVYSNEKFKVDSVVIFDLYFYLKMCIMRNDAVQKHYESDEAFHISVTNLSKKIDCDKNTVQKYLGILEKLKLLTTKKGNFSDRKANEYYLSDKWISVFEDMLKSSGDGDIIGEEINTSNSNNEDYELDPDFDF